MLVTFQIDTKMKPAKQLYQVLLLILLDFLHETFAFEGTLHPGDGNLLMIVAVAVAIVVIVTAIGSFVYFCIIKKHCESQVIITDPDEAVEPQVVEPQVV